MVYYYAHLHELVTDWLAAALDCSQDCFPANDPLLTPLRCPGDLQPLASVAPGLREGRTRLLEGLGLLAGIGFLFTRVCFWQVAGFSFACVFTHKFVLLENQARAAELNESTPL